MCFIKLRNPLYSQFAEVLLGMNVRLFALHCLQLYGFLKLKYSDLQYCINFRCCTVDSVGILTILTLPVRSMGNLSISLHHLWFPQSVFYSFQHSALSSLFLSLFQLFCVCVILFNFFLIFKNVFLMEE